MDRRWPNSTTGDRWRTVDNEDPFYQGGLNITHRQPSSDLTQAIRERISQQLHGRVHNLEVELSGDSVVVISGLCGSFHTKQLAQHAALGMISDRSLENRIEVRLDEVQAT